MRSLVTAAITVTLLAGMAATADAAPPFAPPDRPGPALTVKPELLAASLTCSPGVDRAVTTPVLLVAATGVNSTGNFADNWIPALKKRGIPWCASDVPVSQGVQANYNLGDIAVRGQYVTYAIRTMYARAGRKISIYGHSQGAMMPRWSLRFWPDTRAMVDDMIGAAPSNHGLTDSGNCKDCQPAAWQQQTGSQFLTALNSYQQTFPGISYTTIRTDNDETVAPAQSVLTGPGDIRNWRLQDRCAPRPTDHHLIVGTYDAVSEAFVMDALTHPGPAELSRISPSVCGQLLMSGANPLTLPLAGAASMAQQIQGRTQPGVAREPELPCYVYARDCRP